MSHHHRATFLGLLHANIDKMLVPIHRNGLISSHLLLIPGFLCSIHRSSDTFLTGSPTPPSAVMSRNPIPTVFRDVDDFGSIVYEGPREVTRKPITGDLSSNVLVFLMCECDGNQPLHSMQCAQRLDLWNDTLKITSCLLVEGPMSSKLLLTVESARS